MLLPNCLLKECIKAGGSPRNAGGGIFASAPDRGREPEFRGRARPRNSGGGPVTGISGVDSGGGNRGRESEFRGWIPFFQMNKFFFSCRNACKSFTTYPATSNE